MQSKLFVLCCEVYERVGELIIFPLMKMRGIDKNDETLKEVRNWDGVKDFYHHKHSNT